MGKSTARDAVLRTVEDARDEIVALTQAMIRIPTINPPGDAYEPCARLIGDVLSRHHFGVEYFTAVERPEHSGRFPRVNVVGRREGKGKGPTLHFNGHFDVVPVGDGWTCDPFGGEVRDDRIYGRGASDMKAGIAAAIYAAEAIRRAGIALDGSLEISGTVDEESGGWAGVAHLASIGRLSAKNTDYVIIPEPFGANRICIGHRGVYWFEITTHGRIAHGSMPFLGDNAIEHMGEVLHELNSSMKPLLSQRRLSMPVVPAEARHATLNVNAISGGQSGHDVQSPCVADRCSVVLDRRFLPEEALATVRDEIVQVIERVKARIPELRYEVRDMMVVEPVQLPKGSPLVAAIENAMSHAGLGAPEIVASPGTYDHKHVTRIGGIQQCVAYGPGQLELAHQPDEWCGIDDLVRATQVMALTALDLLSPDA